MLRAVHGGRRRGSDDERDAGQAIDGGGSGDIPGVEDGDDSKNDVGARAAGGSTHRAARGAVPAAGPGGAAAYAIPARAGGAGRAMIRFADTEPALATAAAPLLHPAHLDYLRDRGIRDATIAAHGI